MSGDLRDCANSNLSRKFEPFFDGIVSSVMQRNLAEFLFLPSNGRQTIASGVCCLKRLSENDCLSTIKVERLGVSSAKRAEKCARLFLYFW
jgi:hypothetical protein